MILKLIKIVLIVAYLISLLFAFNLNLAVGIGYLMCSCFLYGGILELTGNNKDK